MTDAVNAILKWFGDNFKTIVGVVTIAITYALANSQGLHLTDYEVVILGGVLYVISQTDPNRDHNNPPPAPPAA